jgi:hypothetical protein
MFEFPEHPIPFALWPEPVTAFDPVRITKTVLPEVGNGEEAVMFTPRSSTETFEPEMLTEFEEEEEEDPVTTRLGSAAG